MSSAPSGIGSETGFGFADARHEAARESVKREDNEYIVICE
jgi:hypothetical protein